MPTSGSVTIRIVKIAITIIINFLIFMIYTILWRMVDKPPVDLVMVRITGFKTLFLYIPVYRIIDI